MSTYRNTQSSTSPSTTPTVTSSTSVPNTTPNKIGDIHVKTDTAKVYMATGTTNSSDWTLLN